SPTFAPCLGRMPNFIASLGVDSISVALGEITEFFLSYDIVLGDRDVRSRGIGVHEYGHTVMCELLRRADEVKAQTAWADILVHTLAAPDAASEPRVISESFADFIALQVVGGTNYFSGNHTRGSRFMNYCLGD